jgi:SPP1 gp7 family putative phage head morphogenesis protein
MPSNQNNNKNTQDDLLAMAISNALRLEQVKTGLTDDASDTLDGLSADLLSDLASSGVFDASQAGAIARRLAEFEKDSETSIQAVYKQILKDIRSSLADVAAKQSQLALDQINKVAGFELADSGLDEKALADLVEGALVQGAPIRDWLERQAGQLHQRVLDSVRDSLAKGESRADIAGKLLGQSAKAGAVGDGSLLQAQAQLDTLVRTATAAVANDAKLATYKENDDVVDGMQWVSVLDDRTTEDCEDLDGCVWDLDGEPIGDAPEFPGDPPIHWNCRSTLIPVLKKWSELSKEG